MSAKRLININDDLRPIAALRMWRELEQGQMPEVNKNKKVIIFLVPHRVKTKKYRRPK